MKVKVICGALVVKDSKFVLVQEAKKHVYGKWSIPAGHLDVGEDIFSATIREVKEETGLDIKLDGLIGIYQHPGSKGSNVVKLIFGASVEGGELKFAEGELLDVKWFSFDEFSNMKDEDLRTTDTKDIVDDYKNRELLSLDVLRITGF